MHYLLALTTALLTFAPAQATEHYRARLSPVPIDLAMQATVAGRGTVRATLAGRTLTLRGDFANLLTAATVARIHVGPVKGARGPAIADLDVKRATEGTITGTADLGPEHLDALRAGRIYVQVHSEKAPDGNLWGWLLRDEVRR